MNNIVIMFHRNHPFTLLLNSFYWVKQKVSIANLSHRSKIKQLIFPNEKNIIILKMLDRPKMAWQNYDYARYFEKTQHVR